MMAEETQLTEAFPVPAPETVVNHTLAEETPRRIHIQVPARHNPTLQAILELVNADEDLYAIWRCANVNAVDRLGMSDHGPVHVQIVANIGLRLLRLLVARGIVPSIVKDHEMAREDAEVVVALASLLHDVGMSIHRDDHERYSLIVAHDKLKELLADRYPPAARRVMISEILHAIIAHRSGGRPLTVEAGVVRVADALDMAKGRSRIPFEAGQINIHSVSAAAIDRVVIGAGEARPIRVSIHLNNSAGIFQLDELLRDKLKGSGLESYVEVIATIEGEAEKRLVTELRLDA
jgi:metal-dependent HD superfamily phosphatase/phosphodiesterase